MDTISTGESNAKPFSGSGGGLQQHSCGNNDQPFEAHLSKLTYEADPDKHLAHGAEGSFPTSSLEVVSCCSQRLTTQGSCKQIQHSGKFGHLGQDLGTGVPCFI